MISGRCHSTAPFRSRAVVRAARVHFGRYAVAAAGTVRPPAPYVRRHHPAPPLRRAPEVAEDADARPVNRAGVERTYGLTAR